MLVAVTLIALLLPFLVGLGLGLAHERHRVVVRSRADARRRRPFEVH